MGIEAYLHGSPGRLPFVGHFRLFVQMDNLALGVAGSVAHRSDVATAFRAARLVETTIRSLSLDDHSDRHDVLNAAWAAITDIDGCDLGPQGGGDLSALFAVSDPEATGIAGVGLGGVWAWEINSLLPLAVGDHPLLGQPGRPGRLPGVLTLEKPHTRFVAIPHEQAIDQPDLKTLGVRCGARI